MTPASQDTIVPVSNHKNFIDRTGQRFERLFVVGYLGKKGKHAMWLCQCDCGSQSRVSSSNLVGGNSYSCGCLQKEVTAKRNTTHGLTYSHPIEYIAWVNIRNRCKDPKNRHFKDYGGRGITFCERWLKFELFFEDVGPRPSPQHSLDRIDNEKGYFPSNVRWATRFEQAANRRSTRLIVINGQSKPVMVWCRELSLKYQSAIRRLNDGYTPEEAFELVPCGTIRKSIKIRVDETHQQAQKSD